MGGYERELGSDQIGHDKGVSSSDLLDAIPEYIEAKINDQIWAHLDMYHEMGTLEEDIDKNGHIIKNFERDLHYLKKSL